MIWNFCLKRLRPKMKRNPLPAKTKFKGYLELTKPNVTILIVTSTALGYYLGTNGVISLDILLYTLLGSTFVSSGTGALNHYAEANTDKLMNRTRSRPIPTGLISSNSAMEFGLILILAGVVLLYTSVNHITAILALITSLLYLFIYTPLKRITWLNTSIGAIPGSLPPVGGWVAGTETLDPEAWILFTILFLWQHPHFFAIAFMCKDDYQRANLKMLPVMELDGKRTNRQILWHSALLIPVSLMPFYIGIMGPIYFWGAIILGILYLLSGVPLIKNYSIKNATLLLRMSVIYLPVLFAIIILDSII
tara:strand:- start:9318 stop:10238 length:921 start_codon:yes stop_codon:yes gene_type:complete